MGDPALGILGHRARAGQYATRAGTSCGTGGGSAESLVLGLCGSSLWRAELRVQCGVMSRLRRLAVNRRPSPPAHRSEKPQSPNTRDSALPAPADRCPSPYMTPRCDAAMGTSNPTKNRRVPTPGTLRYLLSSLRPSTARPPLRPPGSCASRPARPSSREAAARSEGCRQPRWVAWLLHSERDRTCGRSGS
jgi:hypothetical protein